MRITRFEANVYYYTICQGFLKINNNDMLDNSSNGACVTLTIKFTFARLCALLGSRPLGRPQESPRRQILNLFNQEDSDPSVWNYAGEDDWKSGI